jgi:predicted nuclease of restriction endonuclease-like (RecB) superfamily
VSGELVQYRGLLADIKARVRQAQQRAALSANAEMIRLYWDIGGLIAARQQAEGWGAGVIPRLANDLMNELPEEKGFSTSNLKRMVQFRHEYPTLFDGAQQALPPIGARAVPQFAVESSQPFALLSWAHNVVLIQKVKHLPTRLWYARQALAEGWSRDTLTAEIKGNAHNRQGAAVTNFTSTLPEVHASLAQGLLKDPYIFDFLTLEAPFHERELETGLLGHIQRFLLELGQGFAFVGRQYRVEVGGREFYLDLLFYHLRVRCFVVVDLKKGDFKPEYAGKMNFYCSAVDDLLRHATDAPTIGLILCQEKDRILAEYALRDIHKPIGIADYELTRMLPATLASSLPSIESLEAELSADLARIEALGEEGGTP